MYWLRRISICYLLKLCTGDAAHPRRVDIGITRQLCWRSDNAGSDNGIRTAGPTSNQHRSAVACVHEPGDDHQGHCQGSWVCPENCSLTPSPVWTCRACPSCHPACQASGWDLFQGVAPYWTNMVSNQKRPELLRQHGQKNLGPFSKLQPQFCQSCPQNSGPSCLSRPHPQILDKGVRAPATLH
jgi:hypothetical protein